MEEKTELVIIIDKSGSMHGLEKDVVGGYNALIEEQKKSGDVKVTTIFFNKGTEYIHQNVDIKQIRPLQESSYSPSGTTALLDAIGEGISLIEEKCKKEELPGHIIFSIMTDGLENASKEYNYASIRNLIKEKEKKGWVFLFQAANIDVEAESERLGINPKRSLSFVAEPEGVCMMMKETSKNIAKAKSKKQKIAA